MHHWVDPRLRGVYEHPAAPPPRPSHHAANDLGSRLARVEEHIQFSAHDRQRIEGESRMRARDLATAMDSLDDRMTKVEQVLHTRQHMWRLAAISASTVKGFARYVIVALLGGLLLTGHATPDSVKLLLGALGFPAG